MQHHKQFAVQIKATEIGAPRIEANNNTLQDVLGLIYFVAGIVCVIMIVFGGVRYVMSQGEASGVVTAKNTVMYSLVGLLVVLVAAAVTQFIFDRF